jgi:HlyD family secretion protein
MFRKKALERMQSPESLDQLLVVVTPRLKLTLASLAAILAVVIIWSFRARVPISVDGSGIILKPRSIKTLQVTGAGLVTDIQLTVGKQIQAGDLVATIDQPEIQRERDQLVARYIAVRTFNSRAGVLAAKKRDLQVQLADQTEDGVDRGIVAAGELRERVKKQLDDLNTVQADGLVRTRALLMKLQKSQAEHLAEISTLVEEGLTSQAQSMSAQAILTDTEGRVADMETRIKQTSLSQVEAELRDLNLRKELDGLGNQKQQLELQRRQANQDYDYEVQRLRREQDELAESLRISSERLFRRSAVRSQFSGQVLEVSASVGQLVSTGTRLAILQANPQEAFYRLELDPAAVSGSFAMTCGGEKTSELAFDATAGDIRNAMLELDAIRKANLNVVCKGNLPSEACAIRIMDAQGNDVSSTISIGARDVAINGDNDIPTFCVVTRLGDHVPNEELKHLAFFPIGAGKKIAPGMKIQVNPVNIERQRFGSIVGKVTEVSPFPVTSEGIANVIGNTDIAGSVIERGGTIQLEAELIKDESGPTGLKWTSKGPDTPVTAGTTTTCRVTVEERRPITFVIPLLRKWFLGEADPVKRPPGPAM